MLYTALSVRAGRDDIIVRHLISYFGCMAGGNRRDHDCNSLRMDVESDTTPAVDAISVMSIAFMNFATLPFVIQFQTLKNVVGKTIRKFKTTSSTSSITTITTTAE